MIVLDADVVIDKHSKKGAEALRNIIESGDSIRTASINLHKIGYGLQKYPAIPRSGLGF